MSTVKTEVLGPGNFVLYEEGGHYCREVVTVPSGTGVVLPGTVLGKLTADGAFTVTKTDVSGAGKGTFTLASPAYGAGVQVGDYQVLVLAAATNAGTFEVRRPDGTLDGTGTVGVAYTGQVKFTLADGSTDFVVGDVGTVHVAQAAGTGKYVPSPATGTDGSATAVAVALYGCDATSADATITALVRGSVEVNKNLLVYAASVNDDSKKAAKQAQLVAVGIVSR